VAHGRLVPSGLEQAVEQSRRRDKHGALRHAGHGLDFQRHLGANRIRRQCRDVRRLLVRPYVAAGVAAPDGGARGL